MKLLAASDQDLPAMDALRRANQESVGFIPMSKWEWEVKRELETLLILEENGDVIGYIYWLPGWPIATIQQVVTRNDARRREIGTALVNAAIERIKQIGRYGVMCRCRADLEAILFWPSVGFHQVRVESSGRRGPCIRFFQQLRPAVFGDLSAYLPETPIGMHKSLRRGFRFTA